MKKLILVFLASLLSSNISFTCWFDDSAVHYSFFDTEELSDPTMILFLDYEAGLGLGYSEKAKDVEDANLSDWKKYLKVKVSETDLAALIYSMTYDEIAKLQKDRIALSKAAAMNSVLALWLSDAALKKNMGNYLLFAKKCEEQALKGSDYWNEDDKKDLNQLKKLSDEGQKAYNKEKDKFLKNRYAFQVIRAAFYMQKNDDVLSMFDRFFPKGTEENYIYFRALELKAGVQRIRQDDEAAANYARVFVNCPDRRNSCLNSFSFTNSDDWNASLKFCRSNEEKAVFYTMRGLQPNASMIEELEEISAIAPESPMMELLAARYIRQVQQLAFPTYLSEAKAYPQNDMEKSENLRRFKNLLKKMAENNAIKNRHFWSLADAYCGLILKDFNAANQTLAAIPANSTYYAQAQTLLYVAKLLALTNLDAGSAEKLWVEIQENEKIKYNETLIQFFKDVFSLHYQKQGDIARAYLTYFNPYDYKARLDINLLEALEKFVDNCNLKNKYDAFLIEGRYGSVVEAKNILNEQKGVYYLQRNMLDKAIDCFSKCDEQHKKVSPYFESLYLNKSIWFESVIHPYFNVAIAEQNVSFLYEKYPELKRDFNLLSYAQTLKALETKAANEPAKAAEYYYLLGIAWYNTGVQGWHRPAIYYSESNEGNYAWWSADDKLESPKVFKGYDWLSDRYYTPDIAGSYFEKSLKSSGNDELKAKALYMLAKVEKTRDLEQMLNIWNDTPQYSKRYYEAFKDLKSNYANTAFYKDILRECTDFGDYVNRN
jgi:hypothetical protein